jgi:lipoprotein NlpD
VGEVAWRWPVEGKVVRGFSAASQGKQGIEIAGAHGQPVRAASGGRVVYSGNGLRGYGNLLIVKHNGRYLTAYGYNSRLLVKEGDTVTAGQEIALMGSGTDRDAGLHFELRRDGRAVDPLTYLPKR